MTTFSRAKFPACAEIITVARAVFGEDVKVRYVREGVQEIGVKTFRRIGDEKNQP